MGLVPHSRPLLALASTQTSAAGAPGAEEQRSNTWRRGATPQPQGALMNPACSTRCCCRCCSFWGRLVRPYAQVGPCMVLPYCCAAHSRRVSALYWVLQFLAIPQWQRWFMVLVAAVAYSTQDCMFPSYVHRAVPSPGPNTGGLFHWVPNDGTNALILTLQHMRHGCRAMLSDY